MLYFNMLFYYILYEVMLFISLILFHSFDLFITSYFICEHFDAIIGSNAVMLMPEMMLRL